ncbi:Atu4866 domain-containing protein [Cellulomonas chengniuliangii]|uniref:Atu4866 domain-containing protein n=1 Tax=Cellulomonas chengniuliangii TaxID=2968084 RepID=UPI001D0F2D45|nr:Atu4866 domain-containing protein [Cellulomonas chengniuliangii]MCC2316563.1 Atu4866 domain-containing protein [Cellulomonas chengniuliangii]
MSNAFTPELLARIIDNQAAYAQPLLFVGAQVHVFDSLVGEMEDADILLGEGFIVGTGPGIVTAAGDDNALVIDCAGMVIVPVVIDARAALGLNASRASDVGTLWPGNTGSFAIVDAALATDAASAIMTVLTRPESVAAIVVDGKVVLWNGERTANAPERPDSTRAGEVAASTSPYLGMWIDTSDFLHQELTADGRYDETRGGRPHAFQGSFWIDGERIDYLDDLGFWAFGEFIDGVLHHGPYTLERR